MASERMLIVDDHAVNLKLLSYVMRSHGYEVEIATDVTSALDAIHRHPPLVILLDIQLADADGLAVARQLRADAVTRDTVIIAITAYAMRGEQERAIDAGCDAYVTKPIDTRALPDVISQCLVSRAAHGS